VPRDWDLHYAGHAPIDLTPIPLLVELADVLRPGDALDLACGPGRHALHLAKLGWRVTAVDASAAAIKLLREHAAGLPIHAVRADLERGEFLIAPGAYDLICDFFYLQRELFPQIREGVRPGGVFAGAIHLTGNFSLGPGELRAQFEGWKILFYSETDYARIVARKA
jgi:SAM-dependent methyltransferase